MEYDLYTSDDRRYARVIEPDVGESSSGSSYADSHTSVTSANSPAGVVKASRLPPSNQLSIEAEAAETVDHESRVNATESGTSLYPASRISQDLSVPPHLESLSPSSGITWEQEDDHIVEIRRQHSSSTVVEENSSTNESIQGADLRPHCQEELGVATFQASGQPEHGLGAGPVRPDDETHSAPVNEISHGLAMHSLNNDREFSGRIALDRDTGRGSRAESLRRITLSAGSDTSGRRSPPLERSRTNSVHSIRDVREIVLPRWQSDAEVTYCPICRTQFSFFVRKHHCRRCGRVVCNACSPHRITIPYQFIVQPPPAVTASSTASVSHPGPNMSTHVTEATSDFADRDGGMKVRLCNPCVPDPNPLPPQPQYSGMSGQVPTLYLNSGSRPYSFTEESTSGGFGRIRGLSAASGLRPSDPRPQQRSISPYNRHTGSLSSSNDSGLPYTNVQPGRYPGHMPHTDPLRVPGASTSSTGRLSQPASRVYSGQNRGHANRHQSLSFIPRGSIPNPQPHYRSLLDTGSDQYSRTSSASDRPLPPVPHSEEDECPVCHRVLFSRTLPDFENRKAAHIVQCIEEQIALHNGNVSRPGAYTSQSQPPPTLNPDDVLPQHPEPRTAQLPISTPRANTPEARTEARERAHAAVVLGTTSSASSTPPARRTGMFIYRASEKDCVDDAECTICLEEFEVGASMSRLECFCRFHKKCIQDWFVDHPGRCPVHQHDGYGF